jgi:MoCo/4Fe-4S cofactor protein with predicted Tat translocation signal
MREIKNTFNGKEYWRNLDQIADTPEVIQLLQKEFPDNAEDINNPVSRRKFLGLMSASLAFAGLASCRKPVEKIVPYVQAPENIIPGIPKYYATTATRAAHAYGMLVESHEGRPTKIEGNDKHPSSMGKSNTYLQAEILNLYDPDRAKNVTRDGKDVTFEDFVTFWKEKHAEFLANQGEGLALVSGEFSSPSMHRLYSTFKKVFPKADWAVYEAVNQANINKGIEAAAGKKLRARYNFDKAKVIVSIDSDFLGTANDAIANSLGFANGRRVKTEKDDMNRLYIVESSFSITGGMSDHRQQLSQTQIEAFTVQLAAALGVTDKGAAVVPEEWMKALAADLKSNPSASIVIAGNRQSAETHALVFAINAALANNNNTISYHDDAYAVLDDGSVSDLFKKKINTLITLDNNIAYTLSGDSEIMKALGTIENKICFSMFADETAKISNWHIAASHFLEFWGDASAVDGTLSIVQPLIAPLYKTKSPLEFLNVLVSTENKKDYDLVKESWKSLLNSSSEKPWRKVLHDGLFAVDNKVNATLKNKIVPDVSINSLSKDNLEIVFYTSWATYDGRYSNNGWLQEAPNPVTKISWDNAALISPKTATEFGIKSRDLIKISVNGKELEIVAFVLPGQTDYVIALDLGYGRKEVGRIADGTGFDVYTLRNTPLLHSVSGALISKTGSTYVLANTQDNISMEGRPLIREATLAEYKKGDNFEPEQTDHPPLKSLFDDYDYSKGYQWGMAIDLNSCTGCNTCVIACQSENNIPVIGKEQVEKGREMHWMRMDRYFAGDLNKPEMVYQPVACQHCENAPCEQVCPVQATLHDEEGLNVMTYNRCVGTRYCANNCPYKVRRFNFFNFTKDMPETIQMAQNPDVTVRFRGVMEKCTYCTQRIQKAKIDAKNEGRMAKDQDYMTACQQACPSNAIVFGNINDPESEVTKIKKLNRNYALLGELNIRPRTTYLAKLRNPNPAIEKPTETVS